MKVSGYGGKGLLNPDGFFTFKTEDVKSYQLIDMHNKYGLFHGLLNPKRRATILIIWKNGRQQMIEMTPEEYAILATYVPQ